MKWVNLLQCFLPVEAVQQWVRSSKACLAWSLKVASKSMIWRWLGRAEAMKTFSDFRNKSQIQVRQKRPRRRENYWRLSALVPCVLLLSCVRSFPVQNLSSSPTQQEKVEQKSSSDSLVGNPPKNQFRSLLDTYPLWEISLSSPVFWDSISDHPPVDDD